MRPPGPGSVPGGPDASARSIGAPGGPRQGRCGRSRPRPCRSERTGATFPACQEAATARSRACRRRRSAAPRTGFAVGVAWKVSSAGRSWPPVRIAALVSGPSTPCGTRRARACMPTPQLSGCQADSGLCGLFSSFPVRRPQRTGFRGGRRAVAPQGRGLGDRHEPADAVRGGWGARHEHEEQMSLLLDGLGSVRKSRLRVPEVGAVSGRAAGWVGALTYVPALPLLRVRRPDRDARPRWSCCAGDNGFPSAERR